MAKQIDAVNDNVHLDASGLEDRTGFNSFLKATRQEQMTKADDLLKQNESLNDNSAVKPLFVGLKYLNAVLLGLFGLFAAYGLLATSSPALHILSLGVFIVLSVIASAYSDMRGHNRFHALGILAAMLTSFGLMVMVGDYFAITPLQMKNDSLWVMIAGSSLAVGALLKSRVALIISIMTTALWGYGYLSGNLTVSFAVIAFPIIAICQILLSSYFADRVGTFASVLTLCVWGGIVLSITFANGLLIVPMIISGLIMGLGTFYISKSHMLDAWNPVKQKPTYPLVWLFLMGSTLLAVLWLSSPDLFPAIGRTTPLTQIIWKAGLAGGAVLILALSFMGQSRQSYSFARRILGATLIISLAAVLYYQKGIEARLGPTLAAEINLLTYTGAVGSLALLTVIKFISSIKNGYLLWLLASSLLFIGIFLASTQLDVWSLEMVAVSVLAGMITMCAIAWTQKDVSQPTSIYRPLNKRDKKRVGPTQKYSYDGVDINIGRIP